MLKKFSLWLLILGGVGYLAFQIYLNATTTIYYNLIPLSRGEVIQSEFILEKRVLINQVTDDMIQDAYYINNKVALFDLDALSILTTSNVGNNTVEIAGGIGLTNEELKNFSVIYVPVGSDKIYSGAKENDLINLAYFIDPSLNNVIGRQFQTLYGVHAIINNVNSADGVISGIDIMIPNEVVNEIIMLNKIADLTIVKVFSDEDQENEVLSVSGALSSFLNNENIVILDDELAGE